MSGRIPWLTLGVFGLTAVVTGAMLLRPEVGVALERDPAMLHGEWWRFATTWLVETDGWPQIAINGIGLLVFGVLVELRLGRAWWTVGYVVAGLAGEIAGLVWQPVGGGNSVAICGLIGLFSIDQLARPAGGPPRALSAVVWLAIGLWLVTRHDIHGAALMAGFVVAGVAYFTGATRQRLAAA
jgi:rhomboid protease GluP